MKISTREIEDRQMVVEIEIDAARVQRALDQAYRRFAQRVNVPGFRKGRAPRPLVERMVGSDAVMEDAVEHLVPEVFREAMKEESIELGGQPSFELTSREPLLVKATVPLKPRVVLGDYRSIRLEVEQPEVADEQIDRVVERLRSGHAEWVPVERPVEMGDRVALDVTATSGDATVMETRDAEFVVDPNGAEPAPGFSEKLYGLKAGETRTFTLKRPTTGEAQPETSEAAANEDLDYTVTCHEVKEKHLPTLDDEFASQLGEFESMSAVREAIRRDLVLQAESAARERHQEAVVESATIGSTVELPPQLVEQRAQSLANQFASNLERQGISVQQYLQVFNKDEQTIRDEFLAEGRKSVTRQLVLEAVADAEEIRVPETDVQEYIRIASQSAADPRRAARLAQGNQETRLQVEAILRGRRALERLVEIAAQADSQTPEPALAGTGSQVAGESDA
ncbi:MAG: trigger factor [Chloroflexi bacterium]|nr:trigger factor [Chloroflexota bacterium]